MINELYDSILSNINRTGYIDRISEGDSKSLLRWSTNKEFNFQSWPIHKPPYRVITMTHDEHFRVPYLSVINDDGTYENIYR